MKKLYSIFVAIATMIPVILQTGVTEVYAAGVYSPGFPLPAGNVYNVTALANYSDGSSHGSYLYTYGPVKNQTYDPNVVADIAATGGTSIYAVADGKVITNKYGSGGGNYLVIAHDDGTYSYYGHMKARSSYQKGSRVSGGSVVGYVGKTGTATGNHLHFEWSGHDPYCEYKVLGYIQVPKGSAAAKYPHTHAEKAQNKMGTIAFTNITASDIGKSTAQVSSSCKYTVLKPSSVGVNIGTSPTELSGYDYDLINHNKTGFNIWYDLKGLKPGTTYYYQFYAVIQGQTYASDTESFTTQSDLKTEEQSKAAEELKVTEEPKTVEQPKVVEQSSVIDSLNLNVVGASDVTQSSVRLDASCSYSGTRPSSVGVYMGTSESNMTQWGSDTINHGKNPFDIWYNLGGLSAETTYYYQFYAVVNGNVITSEVRSFATQQAENHSEPSPQNSIDVSLPVSGASGITSDYARVDASCFYSGSRPSSVGLYFGTDPSNMAYYDSDSINHNKNPFQIWYDLRGLNPGTTYYYQFYAIVDGQTVITDIYSFTTN